MKMEQILNIIFLEFNINLKILKVSLLLKSLGAVPIADVGMGNASIVSIIGSLYRFSNVGKRSGHTNSKRA